MYDEKLILLEKLDKKFDEFEDKMLLAHEQYTATIHALLKEFEESFNKGVDKQSDK